METWFPALIALLFILVFPLFWSGVVILTSLFGWRQLAHPFATEQKPDGMTLRSASGRIGLANYRGVLSVGVGPDGLYLSVFALFRPGHPPLLIPWTAVRHAEVQNRFFGRYLRLIIAAPHPINVSLPVEVMREAEAWLPMVPVS